MCICKENVFVISEKHRFRRIPIYKWEARAFHDLFKIIILKSENIPEGEKQISLENSQTVFGIGRGVKDKNGLLLVERAAKRFYASIAGTRAAAESVLINERR